MLVKVIYIGKQKIVICEIVFLYQLYLDLFIFGLALSKIISF